VIVIDGHVQADGILQAANEAHARVGLFSGQTDFSPLNWIGVLYREEAES
jgi:hypothetical protein